MVEITGIFHEILISWRPPSQMTSCQLRIWGRILGGSNSLTPHFLNLWVKFVYGHLDTVCWVIHKSKAWECASFSHIVLIEIFVSFPCSVFYFFSSTSLPFIHGISRRCNQLLISLNTNCTFIIIVTEKKKLWKYCLYFHPPKVHNCNQ